MELIKQYDTVTIIEVIVLFALMIKGVISFGEWAFSKIRRVVKKADEPEIIKSDIEQQSKEISQMQASINQMMKKIDTLIASDKDDIKAFITREHHYFVYQKGWIDDYSLDCIEKRYDHYVDEGGNSFIKGLMQEIRKLPKKPTEDSLKK